MKNRSRFDHEAVIRPLKKFDRTGNLPFAEAVEATALRLFLRGSDDAAVPPYDRNAGMVVGSAKLPGQSKWSHPVRMKPSADDSVLKLAQEDARAKAGAHNP
jgi:hypothetical protein